MEYFKYKAQTDFLDTGKLTGDLVSAVSGISERKKAASAEVQKQFDDVQSELNAWEGTKTQSLDELAIKGVSAYRVALKDASDRYNRGEIDATQYKLFTTNAKNSFSSWAKGAQGFDAQLQTLIQRQSNGEGGRDEEANIRYFGEYGNIGAQEFKVQNDGTSLLVEKDKDGRIIKFNDTKFIFNPGNSLGVKVKLDEDVNKVTKTWGNWKVGTIQPNGTSLTIEDIRKNLEYKKANIALQNQFTATPQQTQSVLADFGGYQIANNDAEAGRFLDEMVMTELELNPSMTEEEIRKFKEENKHKIITRKRDKTGQFIPDITPKQLEEAKKMINTKIEMNLGHIEAENKQTSEEREAAKKAGKFPPKGGSKSTKTEDIALNAYIASVDAVTKGDFESFDQENYSYKSLTDANGKKYVEIQPLIKQTINGTIEIVPKGNPIKVYSPDAMTSYLKDIKGANLRMYHSGKDDYLKQYGEYYYEEPKKKTSGKPKTTGGTGKPTNPFETKS
jgi:hypothetical protein